MGGKGKTKAPTPSTASRMGNSSAKGKRAASEKKATATEDELVIFPADKKKKPGGGSNSKTQDEVRTVAAKPGVKQLIGGASWTGKLPVNLLSEHCQKQQWERPDYDMHKDRENGLFSAAVTFSARSAKPPHELTRLEPFRLGADRLGLIQRCTPLEARHAAATFALHRVCSMRNMHMALPPDHKTLWKELEVLKRLDVREQRGWMYESDPFAAAREREVARRASATRKRATEATRSRTTEQFAGMSLGKGHGGDSYSTKLWTTAPRIDMGTRTRGQIEQLLRRETVWNPLGVEMSQAQKDAIVDKLQGLGFRRSHVEEAVETCKDGDETLEWLLLHIPEDDLPRWALPQHYSAGVHVAQTDLRRQDAIERLAESGYAVELCRKAYDESGGDEGRAAEALQRLLLGHGEDSDTVPGPTWADKRWHEDMSALEARFGAAFARPSPNVCTIRLQSVVDGSRAVAASVRFRKSPHFPAHVIMGMVAELAAYIKLSIIKRALAYAESLDEDEARMSSIASWVQEKINDMIAKPGALREVAPVASAAFGQPDRRKRQRTAGKRPQSHAPAVDWTPDPQSRTDWLTRRESAAFQRMLSQRARLPAWQIQDELVVAVGQNQVTIVSGETGSGKSTQSVQFILDDLYARELGNAANLIVTQPRRIAVMGLADRVSDERCSRLGHEVGYSIRGETRAGPGTKITFVTTGVLLRRLQTCGGSTDDVAASLASVSHLFIDEVHERSLDTDLLLSVLRDVLRRRRDLRLVLMSATLDASTLSDYFAGFNVGMVEIAGRTFPVEDHYLDDVMAMTGFRLDTATPRSCDADAVHKIIQKLGRINEVLVAETITAIDADLCKAQEPGSILVFLPGAPDIDRVCSALRSQSSLHVLALHASLDTREQRKVFAAAPRGRRKVVVATNVAETSITIDDVVAVVDSGRVKETSFDPVNNMRRLAETWASRAACRQRRGRAGRVRAGHCYKLYTRQLEATLMAERPEPEIRRVPLEQLCLSVRAMGICDVGRFLACAPTPPEAAAVETAVRLLRRTGCLDGDELTALGKQLALIPADLRCGKLMVFGSIFGCLDECVTMAAILATRCPFMAPADRRDEARAARMRFARGDGDLLTDLRAFQEWDAMTRHAPPPANVRSWCAGNFLSCASLDDIAATRAQFYKSLVELGIAPRRHSPSASSSASSPILRAVTASAFAPQIVRIQFPAKKYSASVSGAVELDPDAKTIRFFDQHAGRVFVHPASTLFGAQAFAGNNAHYLSYFSMVSTTKVFVRDVTPLNPYALLLFSGGHIDLDTQGRGLVVDGWLRLRGWARIGVLVSRLRRLVDHLIAQKVEDAILVDGTSSGRGAEIVRVVEKLVELDGMDA